MQLSLNRMIKSTLGRQSESECKRYFYSSFTWLAVLIDCRLFDDASVFVDVNYHDMVTCSSRYPSRVILFLFSSASQFKMLYLFLIIHSLIAFHF